VRLAFSVAAFLEPEILLVDEGLAVGDAEFQRRCLGRMADMGESGRTGVFVSHNLQTIAQLCDRAILLDGGSVVMDGESAEVVARYLQSGLGAGSFREWPDDATAPGNGVARILSARVLDEAGRLVDAADVRRPIGIEITFRVLGHDTAVIPKLKVVDRQGDIAFNAMDTHARWNAESAPGIYRSTAWIPGNLLNEGLTAVDIELVSLDAPKLRHHAQERNAVSFHVQDPGEGDSARGLFAGQVRGVVRPLLEWDAEGPM
jgi:lipopolysaccharide transport system ATP-binding protein